ncbi:MAG: tetratricopeptide repeat protein [Candidatus Gastranaerophilales bacterium]|nr:tetratricopeptide repeat protein [Candidatus Gastranaerophilales bacterium]MCM1338885.1 tetratricopeptide repeat protein [Muribaculaceae bacterium]
MNKRILIISLILCLFLLSNNVQAGQKQYLQIMHENQYKQQNSSNKTSTSTVKPSKSIAVQKTPMSQTNKEDECKKYFETALKQIEENNLYGAQTSLTKVIDLDPNYIKALHARGEVRGQLGNYAEALQDLDKVISLQPDSDKYYARGYVKLAMQNYWEAVCDFSKAIEYRRDFAMAFHQRGYAYSLYGQSTQTKSSFGAALYDFDKSIRLDPNNIESYLYRGMVKAELFGADKGRADIEYALNEYKRAGDNKGYQTAKEIYNWILKEY